MSDFITREEAAASARHGYFRIAAMVAVVATLAVVAVWAARRGASHQRGTVTTSSGAMERGARPGSSSPRLTAQQIGQFGVTFGTVEQRTLVGETRATGTVAVDETRVAQVAPKFGGFVERLYVDVTGQPVREGQPLMELYSPDVLAAEEELLSARALQRTVGESAVPGVPAQSVDLVGAARRRLELWGVSAAQVDEVLRSGTPRRTVTLYSPASGVVTEKAVIRGQAVQAGQSLYTIADLSRVWIEVALREGETNEVRAGSGADVELAAIPGRTLKGEVAYVYPTVDPTSRTLRARIAVANAGGALKPGMYATVRIHTPSRTALTVPTSAVVRTGERAIVFVDMGGGELMPHEVTLGAVAGDYAEVLSGVERGARVVTSAQYLLDSESNLAEVMRSMIGQGAAATGNDMPGMTMPVGADSGASAKGADMSGMKMPPERR